MTHNFALYGSPHSQFTYKVALMLHLAGEPFAFRYISFQQGMHLRPEFRAFSRWGQVPVFDHGGHTLVQSGAILEYLSELLSKFGARDTATRQRIREWLYWNADRFAPPVYGCYGVKLAQQGLLPKRWDPAVADYHREALKVAMTVFDGYLLDTEYLVGASPTIADICCYGDVVFAGFCDCNLDAWPNINRWVDRLSKLPGLRPPFDLLPMADAEVI